MAHLCSLSPSCLAARSLTAPVSTASSSGLAAVLRCFEGLELEPWWYDLEWCQWCLLAAFQFFFWLALENREPHCTSSLIKKLTNRQQVSNKVEDFSDQPLPIAASIITCDGDACLPCWRCWQPGGGWSCGTWRPPGNHWQPMIMLMLIVWMKYEWTWYHALVFWVNRFRGWSIWIRRTAGNFPYLNMFNWY